jgi:hypothetical protein
MIEAPGIAKQSTSFPNPAKDRRACELCASCNFAILHAWDAGNPWNLTAIPIAMWRCACGCTFCTQYRRAISCLIKAIGGRENGKRISRKQRLKSIWNNIRARLFGSSKERFLWYMRKSYPPGDFSMPDLAEMKCS